MADQFEFKSAVQQFCERWTQAVEQRSPLVGGRLFYKTINLGIVGGPSLAVTFTPRGAQLREGADPAAFTTLQMEEDDWRNVLSGSYSVWSVQLAGRQRSVLEEDSVLRQIGLIMQTFALRGS